MKRAEGIRFLTQCADMQGKHWHGGYDYPAEECLTCRGTNDAGHLACYSQYGRTANDCAPVAWRLAYILARESDTDLDEELLGYAMGLVVNDHDDVRYMIKTYGNSQYV